uniref:Fibronectin type-III domain-containing protein n=1 Tax=Electrophorus electricus TaxID=8005 RepID=A0A4W4DVZ7_ELEEL
FLFLFSALTVYIVLIFSVWMTELPPPPPQHIQIHSSVLMWNSSGDDRNVTYTVQYSSAPGELWDSMTGCSQLQCDFAAKDFYGKVFRVRAERGNLSSDWQQSEKVQCIHINTCAPIINLSIVSDKVELMGLHRDSSLKKEYGGHITFRLLYWKTTSPNDKQNNEYTHPIIMNDLEPGKNYCFQFDYLYFHKPYGNPSRLICKEIPETCKLSEGNHRYWVHGLILRNKTDHFHLDKDYNKTTKRTRETKTSIPNHRGNPETGR